MIAKLKLYLLAGAAFVLALLGIYLKGKREGRKQERQKVNAATTQAVISIVEKKREIENKNRSGGAAQRRQRLRDSLKASDR